MESGRERILKAIDHVQPEVTPVNLGGIYGLDRWLRRFEVHTQVELRDKLGLDIEYARPVYVGQKSGSNLGIFGTPVEGVFGSDGAGYSAVRGGFPLADAKAPSDVESFTWPDPNDFDYNVLRTLLKKVPDHKAKRIDIKYGIAQEGKSHEESAESGPWIPLICTLFDLFGFEETLVMMSSQPRVIQAAVSKIEEFTLEFTRRSLDATRGLADIVFYGDDFATQKGIMISPEKWRRFLKPTYSRVFALIHSYGLKVWFHACGTFRPVLPDLIDCGMDVWETVQAHLKGNDPKILKQEFGKHTAFYGAINTQATLPRGTTDAVRAEVRERIDVLGRDGGYICGSDHGIMPDVPIDNVLAMIDEARKYHP